MKRLFLFTLLILIVCEVQSQLTALPRGGNKRAIVGEQIGITNVTIHYSRPGVKGREGHIWGELIPVGYSTLGYGLKKPAPWRAGANENTTIEFNTDVRIEGHDLPAGKYGFFVAYGPDTCTLIFSKNSTSWGNFFYNSEDDALRITARPVKMDKSVERLSYEFADQTASSATVKLQWEHLMIPFDIEVDVKKRSSLHSGRNCRATRRFRVTGRLGMRPLHFAPHTTPTSKRDYCGLIVL